MELCRLYAKNARNPSTQKEICVFTNEYMKVLDCNIFNDNCAAFLNELN